MTTTTLGARTAAIEDPGDLLARLPDPGGVAWLRHGEGMIGWGQAARIEPGTGPERIARARAALAALWADEAIDDPLQLPGTGPVAFGSFTFDPRAEGSVLIVPEVVVGRRAGRAWLTVVGDATPPSLDAVQALPGPERVRYAGSTLPELAWIEAVADAVRRIRSGGSLQKVVLARDLQVWAEDVLDPRALASRLASRFPQCWTFTIDGLVGATPELLVRRTGAEVTSLVLAGSAARGTGAAADAALGAALLASGKDRSEHDLAVASVRERLTARCAALDVAAQPELLRLANVQHLATAISGMLAAPATSRETALELAEALHPTAAVCGTPTADALDAIRALEAMDRGRYAGPVGWVDARGDGEWGIALRCAEVAGTRARLFAGAGVVADSLPEAELEETRIKLRAMQSALEG